MAVKPHELRNPYGVASIKGNKITDIKEKPISKSYVNAGVYAFNPKILKYLNNKVEYLAKLDILQISNLKK